MTATEERFKISFDDSYIFESLTPMDYPRFVTTTIQILGASSGLRLVFAQEFNESCFNPKTQVVRIPAPPPYPAKDKDLPNFYKRVAEWRGVLNHEVGHARYTLWKAAKANNDKKMEYHQRHHPFVDLFENGRMERVACLDYPGMLSDFQKLEGVLAKEIKKLEKTSPNFNHLYYAMRMAVNGYEPATEIPAKLEKDWEICKAFVEQAWETNDEKETIEIAKKVQKYLDERKKEEEEKEELSKEELKEKKEKLEKIKMEMDELEESMNSEGSGSPVESESSDEKEEGDEEDGEGGSDEVEEDEEGEDEGESVEETEEVDGEEAEDTGEGEGSKSEEEERMEELEAEKEALEKEIEEAEEESPEPEDLDPEGVEVVDVTKLSFEELAKELVKERVKHHGHGPVIPLPVNDYVNNIEVMPTELSGKTDEFLGHIMGQVCGMAQTFIQKVRSSKHIGIRTFQGRLNPRNLHKYRTSRNIFKTQNLRKKKGASVIIVVDCSGSMSHKKIDTALQSALVMGEMMFQAKVEFELVGFTVPWRGAEFDYGMYTRKGNLRHYRFANSKNWSHRKHGIMDAAQRHAIQLWDNDDGESLRQFAHEISQSDMERKMMVVISDGQPASSLQTGNMNEDLKNVIQENRENGIEMYAVGLDTDVASFYGPENSVRLSAGCDTKTLTEAMGTFVGMIANG